MRHPDNDPAAIRGLTRRQYAQILAGASVASIAGCTGGDGDDDDGGSTDADGGSEDTTGEDTGGDNEFDGAQRDTLRHWVHNVPATANMNIYTTADRSTGQLHLTEMTSPRDFVTKQPFLDGHNWDMPHVDQERYTGPAEATVPCLVVDYEVDAPYDEWHYIRGFEGEREPLTYWDGTEIKATDFVDSYELDFYWNGNHRIEAATFNEDNLDPDGNENEYVWHRWQDKGEAPGQDEDPLAEPALDFNARNSSHELGNVMHPDFIDQYLPRFRDSANEDEDQTLAEELESHRITFEDFADNGWGSGPYEIVTDSISQASMTLVARRQDLIDQLEDGPGADFDLRSEHPNEQLRIPRIQLQFADAERRPVLANNGRLDLGESPVLEETGDFNRQALPDHIQELDRYQSPDFGDFWTMNWNNPHLQRLWVRRALVAAIDWFDFGLNGWGERSIPSQYLTGVPDPIALQFMDEEFLESLYQYPIEQDLDLAEEWLRNAGYEGSPSEGWVGPDGRDFTLTIDHNARIGDWVGAHQTAQSHLSQLGIEAEVEPIEEAVWNQRRGEGQDGRVMTYGAKIMWTPGGPIWNWYKASGWNWEQTLVGGDPNSDDGTTADADDLQSDVDNQGRPFVQEVPTEAGAFDAPEEAGITPTPTDDSEEINLVQYCEDLQHPDTTQEEFQERVEALARYANYYVPMHCFHTLPGGLWGNVRDFSFPERGHPALRGEKEFAANEYIYQAGVAQLKYDSDFPAPGENRE